MLEGGQEPRDSERNAFFSSGLAPSPGELHCIPQVAGPACGLWSVEGLQRPSSLVAVSAVVGEVTKSVAKSPKLCCLITQPFSIGWLESFPPFS